MQYGKAGNIQAKSMSPAKLHDVAIYAQAHIDEPLPLERLASVAQLSSHHFHRLFAQATGETPAAYVQRLRLEKAAFRLLLHDDPIVNIALDCGYASHETFTRAFQRQFGVSPSEYRQQQRLVVASRRADTDCTVASDNHQLSSTRIIQLQPLPIAYLRTAGPYETVDTELWATLSQWAEKHGLPAKHMLIGIGHDAPMITDPERLRFDACITVPSGTKADSDSDIHIGTLPALCCAVTTHIGAYATLPAAYPEIFARAVSQAGYKMIGLPAIEIYRDTSVDSLRAVSTTDIYLPLERASNA